MASATRLPMKRIVAVAAVTFALSVSRVNLRTLLRSTFTGPGSTSRIVAIALLIANAKVFPFVWHYRVFHAFFKHLFSNHYKFDPEKTGAKEVGPAALFQPVITSSRSPLYECDYNLHKSNSTYFSDLDVTRSHLVCLLLRDGIKALKENDKTGLIRAPDGSVQKGSYFIMLGGVMSSFKREIKPYESYEMWSRILCWDRKWLYILTHFVTKGTVQPDGYTIGPPSKSMLAKFFAGKKGRKGGKGKAKKGDAQTDAAALPASLDNKNIHASAISKYVMKIGRLTVHPEVYLEASGLLPPRPGGWASMSGTATPSTAGTESAENGAVLVSAAASAVNGSATTTTSTEPAATTTTSSADDNDQWDWKRVEAENARGLKLAEHFASLEGLHEEFTGEDRPALGTYRDFLW